VTPSPGLCATCRQSRMVVSGKGSTFWLCRRSDTDPAYPRYPALPVIRCSGHDPDPGRGGSASTAPEPPEPHPMEPPRTS
jgi:hypothetical protein